MANPLIILIKSSYNRITTATFQISKTKKIFLLPGPPRSTLSGTRSYYVCNMLLASESCFRPVTARFHTGLKRTRFAENKYAIICPRVTLQIYFSFVDICKQTPHVRIYTYNTSREVLQLIYNVYVYNYGLGCKFLLFQQRQGRYHFYS